jgi:hypothetical protein
MTRVSKFFVGHFDFQQTPNFNPSIEFATPLLAGFFPLFLSFHESGWEDYYLKKECN